MITLKVSKQVQRALFIGIASSLVSGVLFFALKTWFDIEGEFGPEKHPWQFPTLKIHAASAFFMMIFSGAMHGSHVQFGWRSKRSRNTGSVLVSLFALQIGSAYSLYYLSDELTRVITEYIHLGVGLTLPLGLAAHIILGRRKSR
ncbi:MAG: hypothetical protein JKX81_18185 [Arenicella sp.]|nr:hypothetical protein [Arenicella sp.]